jgi:hypothetical protein
LHREIEGYRFLEKCANTTTIIVDKRAPTVPETNQGDITTLTNEGGVNRIKLLETNQLKIKYAIVPTMNPKIANVVSTFVLS